MVLYINKSQEFNVLYCIYLLLDFFFRVIFMKVLKNVLL